MSKFLSYSTIIIIFLMVFMISAIVVLVMVWFYPCNVESLCEAYINETYKYCVEKTFLDI